MLSQSSAELLQLIVIFMHVVLPPPCEQFIGKKMQYEVPQFDCGKNEIPLYHISAVLYCWYNIY